MSRKEGTASREGASLSRTSLRNRLSAWLQHHRISAAESLLKVLLHPWSSLLTWLVIAIALALPMGLSVALNNVDRLGSAWERTAQLSIFLGKDVTAEKAAELQIGLRSRESVADTVFVSSQDALTEFSRLSGFSDVLSSLSENPLPNLILVTLHEDLSPAQVSQLRVELDARPDVAETVLDMQWLQRMNSLMELSRRMVLAMGGLLLLGALLILGNTIRLAIESRRDEIVIVKLVGGSNAFVRRPFLYTGLWYGFGGGCVAALLVAAALWYLQEPVGRLAMLYESQFQLTGFGVMGALNLVLIGGALGLAGAWLAVARHLSAIEPR